MQQKSETDAQLFARRLIGRRNELGRQSQEGMPQRVLASKVGVSLRSVQNWEGGLVIPHGPTLHKLAQVLACSVGYLLGEESADSSSAVQDSPAPYGSNRNLAADCREHLERFIANCHGDHEKLSWTKVELLRHFPLNLWSGAGDATMKTFLDAIAGTALQEEVRKLRPQDTAASTNEKTSVPKAAARPAKGAPRDVPGPVPK